jgi:predicted molibdopterin-dependent oxidoreductase YjgC
VFGAGGGTSSYREIEVTDLVVLWGSNAREAHPIFFHHLLKGLRRGARLYVVDPRRSTSAQWADVWLGIDVGSDIALANAIGREIVHAGLVDTEFVRRSTTGFDEYAESVEPFTLEEGERLTCVPAAVIADLAHAYARAGRAQLCWTLGVTEHHTATDNVLALCNLALLTGHVGRYGSGLVPLRGQNNVQGGGDMGALPNKFPGFQDVEDDAVRARFEARWGATVPATRGWHLAQMFEAMERGELRALYVLGENPAQSEADNRRSVRLLEGLDHLVVQDVFLTRTAQLADVVLPAAVAAFECDGTVTSSERRVQRLRPALAPPGGARDDLEILSELARRLGRDWGNPSAEEVWDECRSLSPMHAGMRYDRLEALGGIQWPCPSEDHPGTPFLHARLWEEDPEERGRPAPFSPVAFEPPLDELSPEFPVRLTTGRRLDSYNTGVQTSAYASPLRRSEAIDLSPEDMASLGVEEGERVQVSSRRGTITAPVRLDRSLRPGLAFMSLHFPDEVDTNVLTLDAWDPKSGTAEFKATAVRVDRVARADGAAPQDAAEPLAGLAPEAPGSPVTHAAPVA